MQFEDSIADTIQADSELCAYYSAYQDARRRLSERVKVRGFWPVSRRFDKGGKKGKGKGKGRNPFSGSGSLARRIANSFCRICMQKGHWKNECPQRNQSNAGNVSSSASTTTAPTSFVVVEEIPEEMAHLAMTESQDECDVQPCFGLQCDDNGARHRKGDNGDNLRLKCWDKKFALRFADQWRRAIRTLKSSDPIPVKSEPEHPDLPKRVSDSRDPIESCLEANFVTTGTTGIVDLGASQTVIGDKQVPELLQSLPNDIRKRVQRTTCNLTFRFGNQQTLSCKHALLLPLGTAQFRIAVVPGRTPFLLSSSFLKGIKAIIDTEHGSLWSNLLKRELAIERNQKNLFMMDINQLWCEKSRHQQVQISSSGGLIFQSEEVSKELMSEDGPSSAAVNTAHGNTDEHEVTHVHACRESSQSGLLKPVPKEVCSGDIELSCHIMSSISQKLQTYREGQKKDDSKMELAKIKEMSLEQLSQEKVTFGKAKLGQEFPKAFEDSTWTDWFVQTYESSTKPSHQMFIQYVEKRLNAEILQDSKSSKVKSTKPSLKETQKAAELEAESWDQISETDMMTQFDIPGVTKLNQVEDQVSSLCLQNQNLASRMTQIEMSMQELLLHVRNLSVKSEP
eukprot:s2392_g11.t1